jgi:hypothetical protein
MLVFPVQKNATPTLSTWFLGKTSNAHSHTVLACDTKDAKDKWHGPFLASKMDDTREPAFPKKAPNEPASGVQPGRAKNDEQGANVPSRSPSQMSPTSSCGETPVAIAHAEKNVE